VRILFIEFNTESHWSLAAIGPAYVGAWLRKSGHEVAFLRADVDMTPAALVEAVQAVGPGLIGVSLTTRQWQRARVMVAALRARVQVPLVAGGLHATFAPEQILASPGFDFVCLGEGEEAMVELAEALGEGRPALGIQNIWSKGGLRPTLRPPFEPIDALPYMARDLLDEPPGVVYMCTQRGCPFPCTYCAARMYNELYDAGGQEYGRRRSHRNVLDELFHIRDTASLAYVIFLDDTFTIHHPWVREFCAVYGSELKVPFSLNARVETVNERLIEQLAEAGCKHMTFGVESGSYRIRKEIMKRPVRNERFKQVFDWARGAGITVTANYMIGLPTETRDDLQATLDLAEELAAFDFGYFVFYPYPGTPLYKVCRDMGLLPENFLDLEANHRESILRLPHLTNADIGEYYERFTALRERIYLARQPMLDASGKDTVRELIWRHARHA
jgi:anaerobic magnesium-protoporphyrin IX monomethyl ester cyclase